MQVFVVFQGYLPNPCTKIGPIIPKREGSAYLHYHQIPLFQEICIDLITPFIETISLDVYALLAGKYTVDMNGMQGSFVLDIDNLPSADIDKMLKGFYVKKEEFCLS